jgi:phage gpG-like protein
MQVKVDASQISQAAKGLEKNVDLYRKGLRLQLARALSILDAAIKQNIRQRSGLRVRTGSLLNSIMQEIVEDGVNLVGQIGPHNIPYAAVHEFGHTFKARRVEPRNASVLAWMGKNGPAFSMGHEIGPFTVPARPYLRPALDQTKDLIAERFSLFLGDTFNFKE